MKIYDGSSGDVSGKRFVVAVAEYNKPVTEKLLEGALATLSSNDVPKDNVTVLWVPGAWELAVAAKRVVGDCDAVVCLGAVIKGETSHDQHINSMISQTLGRMAVDTGKPIAFGVLTCETGEQAIQRAGGSVGNKGEEATLAVLQMLRLFDQMEKTG